MSDAGQSPPSWDEGPRTGPRRAAMYRPGTDPFAGPGDEAALAQARRAALREREALRQQRPLVWPPPESPEPTGKRKPKQKRGLFGRRKAAPAATGRPLAPPEVYYEPAGAQGPLPAYPSLDARLQASADVRRGAAAAFTIEGGTVEPGTAARRRRKRGSAMAGGRWRRLVLMTAMLLALSVLVVNGLYRLAGKALYDQPLPPAGSGFPVAAASGYAARFGQAYLTWDETAPQNRTEALRVFFPDARNSELGWDGVGRQSLLGAPVVAGVSASDDTHGVVHLAALIIPGGWTCMDVSVYASADGAAFAITSYLAFIACPPAAVAQLSPVLDNAEIDRDFANQQRQTIESFLKAYAASAPELSQTTTEDSAISGLRGVVSFVELAKVTAPLVADPAAVVRQADIKVRWRLASGGTLLQGYRLTLRQIGGRWFVQRIDGGVEDADVASKRGGVPPAPTARPSGSSPPTSSPGTSPGVTASRTP